MDNTEVKEINTEYENSAYIKLSNRTLALIRCKAKMSDVYSTVYNVLEDEYGATRVDDEIKKFADLFFSLNSELVTLIADSVDEKSSGSHYKEL